MTATQCLNCERPLLADQKFCPSCGQKSNTHRLSFHEVGHDALHYALHADKSIFQLLKDLVRRPGTVAREFIAGKRRKHFKPLNFFLIVAGIVVFMTGAFYKPNNVRSQRMQAAAQRIANPVQKQQLLQQAARVQRVSTITGKYSNIINMVATPLLTLWFWLAFRRRFNYTESLVANLYFTGFIMLLYALVVVPLQNGLPRYSLYVLGAFFMFEIIYRGRAFSQLIEAKGAGAIARAYGISLFISLFWIALTYSLITGYIRSGF